MSDGNICLLWLEKVIENASKLISIEKDISFLNSSQRSVQLFLTYKTPEIEIETCLEVIDMISSKNQCHDHLIFSRTM